MSLTTEEARDQSIPIKLQAGEVVGEITNRDGDIVPIRVLLDTGTTSTILLRDFVHKNISSFKNKESVMT